jgi:hypothetical protein
MNCAVRKFFSGHIPKSVRSAQPWL